MQANSVWRYRLGAVVAVCLAVWFGWSPPLSGQTRTQAAPKAQCGPGERPESGLQGQMTLAERFSAPQTYNCNLEPVGQFPGEGGSFHMATFENCAYYSTTPNPDMLHPGTVVIDASDSRNPKAATYLDSKTMRSSNESLEVHQGRKLLVGGDFERTAIEIYDLSADCRRPVLKGSLDLRDFTAHGGGLTADGRTYYAANYTWNGVWLSKGAVVAVDVSDPAKPRELARWDRPEDWRSHGATPSADGNRVYVVFNVTPARLVILDSSEIQARKPDARFRHVSTLTMEGTSGGQFAIPTTIKGRPYAVYSGTRLPRPDNATCAGSAAAWIIDVSDEKNPKVVSRVMLEVNDTANCSKIATDPTYMGYGNIYCSSDKDQDAKLLACGYGEAGLRVFDIREPARPREIAYYKPRAWRTMVRPGSYWGPFGGVFTSLAGEAAREAAKKGGTYRAPMNDHTADVVTHPVFKNKGNEIWFVSGDGGFHVVRFTDRIKAAEKGLF